MQSIPTRLGAAAAATALLAAACIGSAPGEGEGSRPNVLIIVTDDQRAQGTLQVMPRTRRLIADRGARFTRAVATTPQCCPSRASIFTGRYSHNHGVLSNSRTWGLKMDQNETLHRYLRDVGYRTGFFGKFLNGWPPHKRPAHFDEWGVFGGPNRLYYRGGRWNVDGDVKTIDEYYTSYIARRGRRFIRNSDGPWLLYLWPTAPHSPFEAEERYERAAVPPLTPNPAVNSGLAGKPDSLARLRMRLKVVERRRANQLRTLMSVDDLVSRVIAELRATDQLDDTLIVFTSDNGNLWGEYGIEGKSLPYLHSALIPLLVRWDRRITAGTTSDALVANIDIAATVLDAAGIRSSTGVDGRSLLTALDGERRTRILLEHHGIEHKGIPRWRAILTPSFEYIEHYGEGGDLSFREYYDLQADPWQLSNLAESRTQAELARLSRQIKVMSRCSEGNCP